jgi:hypothetical protein
VCKWRTRPSPHTAAAFAAGGSRLSPQWLRTSSRDRDRSAPADDDPLEFAGIADGTLLAGVPTNYPGRYVMRSGSLILFISLTAGVSGQHATDPGRQIFIQRVDEYVALHRRLEAPLPPEVITADPEALLAPRKALAAAIRTARADARQGDVFSPPADRYFRVLVAEALRKGGITDMLAIVEDENAVHVPARVNADYPAGRSISMMPPWLLAALPPLPEELRYEFVGRDLILWDVHAGLIVDFLPRAIPALT